MINLKQELLNFVPINLENNNMSELPDNVRNSIILYNKAIENIRMDSEDIAMIELKKAIAMNPHCYEAMNLLGLCYCYINETTKASQLFNRVMEAENNSIKAFNYLKTMNNGTAPITNAEEKRKPKVKPQKTSNDIIDKDFKFSNLFKFKKNESPAKLKLVLAFLTGVIIMYLISFVSGYSINDASKDVKRENDTRVVESTKVENTSTSTKLEIDKLNQEISKLQTELKTSIDQVESYKNSSILQQAEKLTSENSIEAAADLLVILKKSLFKDTEKTRFDALNSEVLPKAAMIVLGDGTNLLNATQYSEALKKFIKIGNYVGMDWQYMDSVLYYLGRCYTETNDSRNAIDTYKKLIDTYPKSDFAGWADGRLKRLLEQQP